MVAVAARLRLLHRLGQSLAVVGLGPGLARALLVLPSHERAVIHHGLVASLDLLFLVEALRPVSLLHCGDLLVMVVALEELLDAGPLELGLVLQHLL